MPRKGETARFKGTKAAPTKAVQKERDRKKARDKQDAPICDLLGCRGRLAMRGVEDDDEHTAAPGRMARSD